MLEDRSYMRKDSFGGNRSMTFLLIVVLVSVFVLQNILYFYTPIGAAFPFNDTLALSNEGLAKGYLWQLVTFQFLHSGPWPWHLLFNCLALFFFGRSIEETLGSRNFLKLYFLSGIIGGLLQSLVTFILPGHTDIPVVGASAGVLGLLTAFALLFPEQEIMFWILLFPVRIKAKFLLWFTGLISAYGTLVPFDNYAHAAHLGGMIGGWAFLRWGSLAEGWFTRKATRPRSRYRQAFKVAFPKREGWKAQDAGPEDLPPAEFISQEVDPILDKISAHGIQSLTPQEKKILEAARAKMERR